MFNLTVFCDICWHTCCFDEFICFEFTHENAESGVVEDRPAGCEET